MALPPWLYTLPKAARLFYPIAQKGISQGLSANSILKSYHLAKPGIRRTLGLEVVRRVRGVERASRAFKGMRLDLHPDVSRIPEGGTRMGWNLSYKIEYQAVTTEGKSLTAHVTVVSDEVITRRQAEEMAASFFAKTPEEYGIESVQKIQLVGITKAAGFG